MNILTPYLLTTGQLKCRNPEFADSAAPEGQCGIYPVPETCSSKAFYFLPHRQAEDNGDKTLPSPVPHPFNVALTKKTAKPASSSEKKGKSLSRSQRCQIL